MPSPEHIAIPQVSMPAPAFPGVQRLAQVDRNLLLRPVSSLLVREVPDHVEDQRRSEEHTSELQSRFDIVCRLLLEKKKNNQFSPSTLPKPTSTNPPHPTQHPT